MKVISKGFTLIELLIVVAIIAILAAIAIPNFLAAQVRAKVSRVKGEFHSIAIGIESYYVDENTYLPSDGSVWPGPTGSTYEQLYRLTTPITYLSKPPYDLFQINYYGQYNRPYQYYSAYPEDPSLNGHVNGFGGTYYGTGGWYPGSSPATKWVLDSLGPDAKAPWDYSGAWSWPYVSYDPTNGTVSAGDIYRTGP